MMVDTNVKEVNGISIYYEHYQLDKEAKTIVLIHGFLSSSFSFRRLIPFLQKEYNVIAVDLPPFGKSGKIKNFVYSHENIAKTVIALLEELSLNRVTLVGHSMGGQISLFISYLRPDLVEKNILLCSSAYLKPQNKPLILSSYLPFFHLIVKLRLMKSGLRNNLELVVYDRKLIDENMESGYLEPFLDENIFRALTRMIRDHTGDLTKEQLTKIATPCLLIWGDHDRVVPLAIGRRLHQDLQNSALIVLKETGHLVPEERPEEVYNHIKRFMEGETFVQE
jgi:pimeloyl-ACP methyl ester carboxylesterase